MRVLPKPCSAPTAFKPEDLLASVREVRNLPRTDVPEVCLLEFDGDLTDWLAATGRSRVCDAWACFHTRMHLFDADGFEAGMVDRTIGGPYAVLVAEQLLASGARVILGLTSAGRIAPDLRLPAVVVAQSALRDEGTSHHYLPPADVVETDESLVRALYSELQGMEADTRIGIVWTTDAPYRETLEQIEGYRAQGVLAVEMQAASLYAFAQARGVACGVVAHVSNAVDHRGDGQFDRGGEETGFDLAVRMARAGRRWLREVGS
ncbi:MAG: nucleoside phosphorylase [Bryobacteraceae bacterium]|nr:nucleoside phosphorylase [Bryobacteraceae bacterium]